MGVEFQRTNPYTPPLTYQLRREDFFSLMEPFILSGNIVDVEKQEIFSGRLHIMEGIIQRVEHCHVPESHYILTGFVDASFHLSAGASSFDFANRAVESGCLAALSPEVYQADFKFFFQRMPSFEQDGYEPAIPSDICEAEEEINKGRIVIIAGEENFLRLYPLINQYPCSVILATNECRQANSEPLMLIDLVKVGLSKELNFYNLLRSISTNTINNYRLPIGLLRENDAADCIIVDNLQELTVIQSYIDGRLIFEKKQ